jgi:hypothetical protein
VARESVISNGVNESQGCRKFGLSDAMVVVAGTALILASGPFFYKPIAHPIEWLPRLYAEAAAHASDSFEHWPVFWAAIRYPAIQSLWFSYRLNEMYLFGMIPTFFVIRLKRPRPALRGLIHQPGTVASLAIIFGMMWVSGYLDYFSFYFRPFPWGSAAPLRWHELSWP